MKKTEIIELLEKMEANAREVSKIFAERGNTKEASFYSGEQSGIRTIIYMLSDKHFLEEQAKIFKDYEIRY